MCLKIYEELLFHTQHAVGLNTQSIKPFSGPGWLRTSIYSVSHFDMQGLGEVGYTCNHFCCLWPCLNCLRSLAEQRLRPGPGSKCPVPAVQQPTCWPGFCSTLRHWACTPSLHTSLRASFPCRGRWQNPPKWHHSVGFFWHEQIYHVDRIYLSLCH